MFDFFSLHDFADDNNVRQLLRIYGVLPKYSKIKQGPKAEQAIIVVDFLQKMNSR